MLLPLLPLWTAEHGVRKDNNLNTNTADFLLTCVLNYAESTKWGRGLTCLGPLDVVSRRFDRGELRKSDDDGTDWILSARLPRLSHERQPSRGLPCWITDPYQECQTVLSERPEYHVQLLFRLGDRNQIPGHLQILWFLVDHLQRETVHQHRVLGKNDLLHCDLQDFNNLKTSTGWSIKNAHSYACDNFNRLL